MATAAATFQHSRPLAMSTDSTAPHWSIYAVLFASTSVILGVIWDISWHRSIGRDTFWTPAHLAIYTGGVVAGLTCGWVALQTTFAGSESDRGTAVRFWGFRAPFGAWVCIWGAFAMVTSAPFDDWWHNAYGLDVKIISPPHMLLAAGIAAIQCGAMLMALAWQNRAVGDRRLLGRLYLYGAGLLLLLAATVATEHTQRWDMHQTHFYQVSAGVFLFFLVSSARASFARWPATIVASVYTGLTMFMLLFLPLFAAQPLLGPIYVQVDRFMPPDFPLLLIVPAIALDLVMRRGKGGSPEGLRYNSSRADGRINDWLLALVASAAFLVTFFAVQWPFADFLMTPAARNWFFASDRMQYSIGPAFQAKYFQLNPPDNLATGLPIALAIGFVSARCALWWGNWMARVQR
ncbi:MAG TPA: hypothetical protein VFA59_11325 [Vicinamibacterales bacterium]|nr:hypothetical protein [Vicinamibacterales bacterium]